MHETGASGYKNAVLNLDSILTSGSTIPPFSGISTCIASTLHSVTCLHKFLVGTILIPSFLLFKISYNLKFACLSTSKIRIVFMDSLTASDHSSTDVTPPSLLPPPGVTSNFINPVSHGPALVITSAVCITLMIICVTIRLYTKFYIRKTWGWDDCLC